VFKDEQSAGYKPVDAAQNPDPVIRVFLFGTDHIHTTD